MDETVELKRCEQCKMFLVEVCKKCHSPEPFPYHGPYDSGKTFEGSGVFVCLYCDHPFLELIRAELSRLNVQWDLNDYPKGVEPQTATEANLIYCALTRLEKK